MYFYCLGLFYQLQTSIFAGNKNKNMSHPDFNSRENYSFSIEEAVRFTWKILFISLLLFAVPYCLLHGITKMWQEFIDFIFKLHITLPVLIAGIFAHESLHAATFLFGQNIGCKDVKFGFSKKALSPYVNLKKPVKAILYKIGALVPLVVLGILPSVLSLVYGWGFALYFGIIFIFGAGADIFTVIKLKNISNTQWVLDHPEEPGCFVYKNKEKQ